MASIEEVADSRPPRIRIFNLRTNEGLLMQFNPTQFSERLAVNYGRPTVLGMSHQELQYLNTTNLTIPMEFFFLSRDPATHEGGAEVKRFLYSFCYPVAGADAIVGGAPPRALVVWPGVLSLTAKLTQLNINNQRFNRHAEVVQFTANCQFEEMRNVRFTSDDARRLGVRRTGESPGGAQ